ncbi:hypothetical protein CAFEL_09485 [Corynebacterium afermentans subsp. lipophilum]|nr:hypothetical protein CAFEL_09485 [Corynebacterium afermentans subsp. lipophilum]
MITAVKYHVRRIVALLILFLLVRAGFKALLHDEPSDPPAAAPETSVSAEPRRQAAASIAQGRPVEMVVPVLGLRAGFEQADCRVVDGKIDPKSMDKACALTGEGYPYELPGTDAGDIVVVAGHTGAGVDAVFNKLYDGKAERHTVAKGDTLFLRTETSGDDWLKYTATDLHDPDKGALASNTEIWGTGPMPGRLLTISCIQPANLLADSVRNAVVGWQLAGTATDDEVEMAFEPR